MEKSQQVRSLYNPVPAGFLLFSINNKPYRFAICSQSDILHYVRFLRNHLVIGRILIQAVFLIMKHILRIYN